MKIKLSKSQWEGIGKKAGWMKSAKVPRVRMQWCNSCGFPAENTEEDENICSRCGGSMDDPDGEFAKNNRYNNRDRVR